MLEALNSYLNTNHECAKYLEKYLPAMTILFLFISSPNNRYGSLFGAGDVLQVVRLPELLLCTRHCCEISTPPTPHIEQTQFR